MPDWVSENWVYVVGTATILGAIGAWRTPWVRRKLGLKVKDSEGVTIKANDATEADVAVKRSKDVKIDIGE
ncbi:MAG: hypothetical protein WBD01_09935 [Salaquimonas sp.]